MVKNMYKAVLELIATGSIYKVESGRESKLMCIDVSGDRIGLCAYVYDEEDDCLIRKFYPSKAPYMTSSGVMETIDHRDKVYNAIEEGKSLLEDMKKNDRDYGKKFARFRALLRKTKGINGYKMERIR